MYEALTKTEIADLAELAANRHLLVGIGPLILGIIVVAGLITAFVYGMRSRRDVSKPARKSPPPGSQTGSSEAHVHPAEMPHDGRRRMPYEVTNQGSTTDDDRMSGEEDGEEEGRRGDGSDPSDGGGRTG